jgi:hypothetical protein
MDVSCCSKRAHQLSTVLDMYSKATAVTSFRHAAKRQLSPVLDMQTKRQLPRSFSYSDEAIAVASF